MELRNNQRAFIRELQWERADTVLQLAVVAPALAMVVGLMVSWPNVPERVPMHFDALGAPDAWTGKTFVAVVPTGLAVVQTVLLSVLARRPHVASLPVEVTLRSAQPIYKLTRRALLVVALLLNVLVAVLLAITIATGSGSTVWKAIPLVTGGTFGFIALLVAWLSSRLKAIARAHGDHEENSG
jgi:uncharacterized membrane protein